MLESWRLKRVLNNLGHLDDSLLQPVRISLLTRSIANEGSLSLALGDVLRLSSFDLPVHELLQCRTGLVCGRLHIIFRWSIQTSLHFVQVLPGSKGDEVLELGLNILPGTLSL